ncbi:DUF421 domain-containing protein [Bacillus amyloliquefaciens]|uniref:DUF421 domain-containing protein n=1 Tax=Bacillus amyloliquefaciens TaxID=1390 RepID=UPI000F632601|nr:DUF421 domain-containing protein [Bacillus amyloliquefaciens]MCZ4249464.1 DUF421 domain-containing protein [Bacillus amyloliquefaciens]QBG57223.1 DUF421 domain-containing protein [Bacillus amyloliquefaciens]
MGDIFIITFRTIVLYIIILVIFRLMGKREIGELSILDFVVSIMIAEIAVLAIENVEDQLLHTIVPIVILMIIQVSLAFVSLKSQKIRQLLDGKPTTIIKQGKIDERAMRSQRYNFDDLLMQLRENNIERISDVSYAVLESSGKLSIVKKKNNKDKQLETPLIVDGVVQNEHLDRIGKDKQWLEKNLAKRGYRDLSEISFCTFTDGAFFIDIKNEKGEP